MYNKDKAAKFLDNINSIAFFDAWERIKKDANLIHSDRWSMIFDLLEENNYSTSGSIVTDLTYYMEEEM
jgi:hypothetical protein